MHRTLNIRMNHRPKVWNKESARGWFDLMLALFRTSLVQERRYGIKCKVQLRQDMVMIQFVLIAQLSL
jgi:hypothetical protein